MPENSLFTIFLNGVFIENFILIQFLGLCPFLGVTKETRSAVGMSAAVIFVMTIASAVTFAVASFLLIPFNLGFLELIAFIVVIASLVQLVEYIIRKHLPPLYKSLGIYLPLIASNCAVLGLVLLNRIQDFTFVEGIVFGVAAGIGFGIVMILMSAVRERSSLVNIPSSVKGVPYAFFAATMLSMAFVNYFEVIPL